MIEASGLVKKIGRVNALDGVSFELTDGRAGLLGRNGAGKSTLLRILTGLWVPTAGRVRIDGLDPRADRVEAMKRIGYMPEWPQLHPALRARTLLEMACAAHRVSGGEAADRIERFGIGDILDVPAGELSHGQKRAVTLVAATLHAPPVLLLDEPTNGLDPIRVRALREWIASDRGPRLLLVSTHQLDFIRTVADRYLVLHEGRLIADGDAGAIAHAAGIAGEDLESAFVKLTAPR